MKIKLLLFIIFSSIFCFIACKQNNANSNDNSDDKFDQRILMYSINGVMPRHGKIAIDVRFTPTLKLTDEIRNTSLEDLIKQDKGQYTEEEIKCIESELKIIEQIYPSSTGEYAVNSAVSSLQNKFRYMYKSSDLKFVSPESNLAKVFYLESKLHFETLNGYYVAVIKEKEIARKDSIRKAEIQMKWKEYE